MGGPDNVGKFAKRSTHVHPPSEQVGYVSLSSYFEARRVRLAKERHQLGDDAVLVVPMDEVTRAFDPPHRQLVHALG